MRLDAPVRLVAATRPFSTARVDREVPAGATLAEMVEGAGVDLALIPNAHVWLTRDDAAADAVYVPIDNWRRVRPKPGTVVTVRVAPSGGGGKKNPLRTILTIAVLAASIAAPGLIFTSAFLATTGGALAGAALSAGVGLVGSLLVNAIVPPPRPKLGSLSGTDRRDSPTLSIAGARNRADPYGPVPIVLGRHLVVPPYAAQPYTELVGADQYLRLLFCCGYGPLTIEDIKIGETAIADFDDVETEIRAGADDDDPRKLYSDGNSVAEDPLTVALTSAGGWQSRTSGLNADELSVDITFDQGLVEFTDSGGRTPRTVTVELAYSPTGEDDWTAVKTWTVTENRTSAVRLGHRWTVTTGQYDVRLRRTTADTDSTQIFDRVVWTCLRTIRAVDPIQLPGMATIAVRIRATEQLSGIIDQLSCVATRIALDWDAEEETWTEQETRNPAAQYRYLLQGPFNHRALADSRLALTNLEAWHEDCADKGWSCDAVIDFSGTLKSLLDDVAAAGRAAFALIDGKYGVVRDVEQTVPVQMFTPRNSWDFRGEKAFLDRPHALKIRFIDEDAGWRQGERIVYADGYSAANATRFETGDRWGVTDSDLIWKHGRYDLAALELRPELFSLSCGVEHIVCTRGDLVRVAHDAIAVGLAWGRVKSLTLNEDGDATAMTLDETVGMEADKSYAVQIRKSDGTELARTLETAAGQSATVTFASVVAAADLPAAGDLVLFGEAERVSLDGIVHHIEMLDDLAARIFLVDAAPDIHDADTGTIPDYDPLITVAPTAPPAPQVISVESGNRALTLQKDGTVQSRIMISLAAGAGAVRSSAFRGRYRLSGSAAPWVALADVPAAAGELTVGPVTDGLTYDLEVQALAGDGTPSPAVTILDHTVVGKTQPPPQVDTFTVARLADGTRKFSWTLATVPADVKAGGGYRIYWFRGSTSDLDDMALLPPGFLVGNALETNELSAGDYTFAITVVDSSGNESEPVFIEASLGDPRLRGVLTQLLDHEAGWPGTLTDCFVGDDNVLRATTSGGWEGLADTWSALADTWNGILTNASPIRYATQVIDLGADLNFTPQVTPDAADPAEDDGGTVTIEMKTGTDADGDVTGDWAAVATVAGARYVQIRVSVAGTTPELRSLTVLIDGETVVEDFEDIDTSAASAGHVERVATGHFRVETKGDITTITSARVTTFQNAGSGWTWERIKPAAASGVLSAAYAEFKIYQNGTLTDAVVDVELKGNK